jgi:hypothetical protein
MRLAGIVVGRFYRKEAQPRLDCSGERDEQRATLFAEPHKQLFGAPSGDSFGRRDRCHTIRNLHQRHSCLLK